jgi:two-component system CheB/CheR fusion protein
VPAALRKKYFELLNGRYIVRPDLRRAVIFGRHDLAQDAPISNLDLLICRNTLIYFNAETQRQILARFHFALRDEGILFLGQAEMLLSHAHLFKPVHVKHRLFARRPQADLGQRIGVLADATDVNGRHGPDRHAWLRQTAFEAAPVAQLVIDQAGRVIWTNAQARASLGLDRRDVGRPFQDLEISYRPVELRSLMDRAREEGREILATNVQRSLPGGEEQYLDIHVIPLYDDARQLLGTSLVFENMTQRHEIQEQAAHTQEELETTYEELQSTNEELETTNEELQSAVEELQTTNEELQSTNEEMETMNEELHSSNEELRDMNVELRQRTLEAQRANEFLESILASVDVGVVVLDRDLEIQLWNHRAEDMWGLRADEVRGQVFLDLDIGLPVDALEEFLAAALHDGSDDAEIAVEGHNRRGRTILCHVQATTRLDAEGEADGVVLLMEEEFV